MTGSEEIVDKIIKDARGVVNSTMEEANSGADAILKLAYNDAKIYQEKNMAESYKERDEIVRRKITVANLEVRKRILQAKQKILEKTFTEAFDAVKSDKNAYKKLIEGMLKFAEEGDVVTISSSDKDLIDEEFILNTAKKNNVNVKVNSVYGDFCGGIIISGKNSDKNLSLEVEMSSIKDEFEPEIAGILFGD